MNGAGHLKGGPHHILPPFNVLFGDIGNTFAGMLESDQDKNLKAVILSGTQLCRRSPKTTGTGRENLQLRSE